MSETESTVSENVSCGTAMPLFIVETISTFRHRYAVRARCAEHAMDEVVIEAPEEMSQLHVGEQVISSRRITMDEYIEMFDQDNEYAKSWTDAMKTRSIHTTDYGNNGL